MTQSFDEWLSLINNAAATEDEKRNKPLTPSGTTNAGFRQMEAEIKAPLTFAEWKSRGNADSALTPLVAGVTYPIAKAADLLTPEPAKKWASRAGQTGGEIMTMVDSPDKTTTGSGLGDVSADLAGGLMGFLANPAGATNVGAGLWKGAEEGISALAPKIPGLKNIPDYVGMGAEKIAPKIPRLKNVVDVAPKAKYLAKYTGKVGGATVPWESARALANDREISPGEMGLAAGANVLGDLALMGLSKGLARRRPTAEEIPTFEDLFGDTTTADTGEYRKIYPRQQLALPEGTGQEYSNIPNFELPTPGETFRALENQKPRALTGTPEPLALPEGYYPNWEFSRFHR